MTTKNKTASKTATPSKAEIIKDAVKAYYLEGVTLNDTAQILASNGIEFTAIQKTIQTIGIKEGYVLTPEKIAEKVKEAVSGKVISHFLDVATLAKELDIAQLSEKEKQDAIIEFSGVKKSVVKMPSKFRKLANETGLHGSMVSWVKEHPDFTPAELHNSGSVVTGNSSDYYDELLSYFNLYETIYGKGEKKTEVKQS